MLAPVDSARSPLIAGYFAVDDPAFAQKPFPLKVELFQRSRGCRVARIDVGLYAIQLEPRKAEFEQRDQRFADDLGLAELLGRAHLDARTAFAA